MLGCGVFETKTPAARRRENNGDETLERACVSS